MQVDLSERPLAFREIFSSLPPPSAILVFLMAGSASAQWPQWGGQDRNFHSSTTGLAEEWPAAGPRRIWERALGAGHSSIVADGGMLFTMYRSGDDEVVVALDAQTGATAWEHKYHTARSEAPNSTPTVEGNKLYTLGVSGVLCALDKSSGKLAWSHDLVKEYNAKRPQYGFSASPLAYAGSLILPVYFYGSTGNDPYFVTAILAKTGEVAWQEQGLSLANVLSADGKILLLDYEGVLGLATARPEAWKLSSKVSMLKREAFTTPTLADKNLYLRDQERIIALDLGKPN